MPAIDEIEGYDEKHDRQTCVYEQSCKVDGHERAIGSEPWWRHRMTADALPKGVAGKRHKAHRCDGQDRCEFQTDVLLADLAESQSQHAKRSGDDSGADQIEPSRQA